jgi:hypothetical protein
MAYAAGPYPGANVLYAFGLASQPQSDYPPLAQSSYPTQGHAASSAPGVTLTADSQPSSSSGTATSGVQSGATAAMGVASATAAAGCAATGTVTARAESDDQVFSLDGGLLRIGRVHSMAEVVVGPDGQPQVRSQLDVAQMTVAGQTVEFSDKGLVAGGSPTALPPSAAATQELASEGITVMYLAASRDPDGKGIVSPAVAITVAHQAQAPQPTELTYVLGQSYARAAANGSGLGENFNSSSGGPAGSDLGGSTQGAVGVPATPGGSSSSLGVTGQTPVAAPVATATGAPSLAGSASQGSGPRISSPGGSSSSMPQAAFAPYLAAFSSQSLYLGIVVGACVLLGSLVLLRLLGVKTRWM